MPNVSTIKARVAPAALALLLPIAPLDAQSPEQARAMLVAADESREPFPRNVLAEVHGFGGRHLTRLARGETVTGHALFDGDSEVAVVGAVRLEGDRDTFVRTLDPDWRFRNPTGDLRMGVFSRRPRVSDLDGFRMDAETIEQIRDCRPGDCDVQITATGLHRVRDGIDWNAPDAHAQVERRYKEFLVELMTEYIDHGFSGTETYEQDHRPIDRVVEFSEVLGHAVVQRDQEPILHDHLARYPQGSRDGAQDVFYWVWAGGSPWSDPSMALIHGVVWRDPADRGHVAIADKLVYASHYATAALAETMIVADKADPDAFYVVRSQRARFEVGGGLAHGFVMGRVHDAMRLWLEYELDLARQVAARR